MSSSSRKAYFFGFWAIFCLGFLLFASLPAKALETRVLDSSFRQVRTRDNATVYYLYHAGHRRKAYLNADTYLNYGNKWSEVKFVTVSDLVAWPEAKLIKKADSPAVYYIKENKKVLIVSWTDLESFSLDNEPILTVSQTDLNQYQESTYEELGLKKTDNILVFNDSVDSSNNVLLTNTDGNLMGIFRFRSPLSVATVTAVTFNFSGLYSGQALESVAIFDENNLKYKANVNVNSNERRAIINFREPLALSPNIEKTLKVFLDIGDCACDQQTIRVELKEASSTEASLPVLANFPLRGQEFKIMNGSSLLGQIKSQEESISTSSQNTSLSNRLLGKYTLSEESGFEDVLVKNLIFSNNGSANKNDWEDFRLLNNDQVISRASELNSEGDIEFVVNYLRLTKNTPANLTVIAALKTDYNKQATVDLNLQSIWSQGKTYNAFLSPKIFNKTDSFILN